MRFEEKNIKLSLNRREEHCYLQPWTISHSPKLQIDSKTSIFQQIRSEYLGDTLGGVFVGRSWGGRLQGTDFSGASKDPVDFTLVKEFEDLGENMKGKLGDGYMCFMEWF